MSSSPFYILLNHLILYTPVILTIYYQEITKKIELSSARQGFTNREKLNMDMIIYAMSFLFCSALSIDMSDYNLFYVVPILFISGVLIHFIVTEYVKLQDSYQRRGANLRRNISLSRTLDPLHQSHTFFY